MSERGQLKVFGERHLEVFVGRYIDFAGAHVSKLRGEGRGCQRARHYSRWGDSAERALIYR